MGFSRPSTGKESLPSGSVELALAPPLFKSFLRLGLEVLFGTQLFSTALNYLCSSVQLIHVKVEEVRRTCKEVTKSSTFRDVLTFSFLSLSNLAASKRWGKHELEAMRDPRQWRGQGR